MVWFFFVDPILGDSNSPSVKMSLGVGRVASPLRFQAQESRDVFKSRGRTRELLCKSFSGSRSLPSDAR